jgi:RNA polymerase sigma-70 factor (ECF subfamily)
LIRIVNPVVDDIDDIDLTVDFAGAYEQHYQAVYRAARSITLDAALAEDVTQDAFLKAFRNRDRYKPRGRLQQWLCTIAVREAISRMRRLAFQRRIAQLLGAGDTAGPPDYSDRLVDALLILPPRSRAIVTFRFHYGYRYREIAEMLRIPEGTVASRLSDALLRMRRHLERNR